MFFQGKKKHCLFYSAHIKSFWIDLILKITNLEYFSIPLCLPFWLPWFFLCVWGEGIPVGRVWNQFKPFLRSQMGQCKGNLFSHVLRSGGCNKFYRQCPCCRHFIACLPFVTFNPGKTSMCTLSDNLPAHIHSLEIVSRHVNQGMLLYIMHF